MGCTTNLSVAARAVGGVADPAGTRGGFTAAAYSGITKNSVVRPLNGRTSERLDFLNRRADKPRVCNPRPVSLPRSPESRSTGSPSSIFDSSRTLPYGSLKDVEQEVREAIAVAAPGYGYILASDHSLHDGIPVANIRRLFETGRKYGGYPLAG